MFNEPKCLLRPDSALQGLKKLSQHNSAGCLAPSFCLQVTWALCIDYTLGSLNLRGIWRGPYRSYRSASRDLNLSSGVTEAPGPGFKGDGGEWVVRVSGSAHCYCTVRVCRQMFLFLLCNVQIFPLQDCLSTDFGSGCVSRRKRND